MKQLAEFDDKVLPLKQDGVLHAVPPQMQAHPDFLHLLTADLEDPRFWDVASRLFDAPLFVARRKVEPVLPLVGADL